jgi:hypothetical protein
MKCLYQGCLVGTILLACGGHSAEKQPSVLAETENRKTPEIQADKQSEAPRGIEDRIDEDKRLAAQILLDAMGSKDTTLAAWAAVYVVRLGLKHDQNQSAIALTQGTLNPTDPLLNALCWRLLATVQDASKIPDWAGDKEVDRVVQILAALALAKRGPLPKTLKAALGLPEGDPIGPDRGVHSRRLVERLLAYAMPYDNGPLSLAIAFVEARRGEWTESASEGKTDWVARRLRNELVTLVLKDHEKAAERILASKGTPKKSNTTLLERLNTPLVSRPLSTLRRAALAGPTNLRREAVRAIAVVATKPVAGDFGAAAAALTSDDRRLQVEGARTFLLFFRRTTR